MARARLLSLLALGAAAACSTPAPPATPPAPGWSFSLDGEPLDERVLSMDGDPDRPSPGDLIAVGPWLFPLEKPGPHDFLSDHGGTTALALREGDGTPRRVGLVLDGAGLETLAAMSDDEARALRCLRIESWSEEAARQVARLDGSRLAVIFAPTGSGTPLPALPPPLPWLAVEEKGFGNADSLEALAGLRSLRFLRVRRYAKGEDFDAGLLARKEALALLDLSGLDIGDIDLLGTLHTLRVLDLSRCGATWSGNKKPPLSVEFAGRLPRLRTLALSGSSAISLAPLGGHPTLEEVWADGLRLEALPSAPLPSLRSLRLVGTTAGEEEVAAFRAANPGVAVVTSPKEVLLLAVSGADRVLLRTGGTCHRDPDEETVLFESQDPERIRWVLDAIILDGLGGRCMCCGDPTIEFHRGATLLAELGIHHGMSLRWRGGWPGDAVLTPESRDLLTGWMAENGAPGPLADWKKDRAQVRSARARWQLLTSRMPPDIVALVEKGTDREGFARAVRETLPDPIPRAILCLRLFGTGEGAWIKPFVLDFVLETELLPEVQAEDLRQALWNAPADDALADGAARWLFAEDRLGDLDTETVKRILPVLGERALAHPRAYNRRRTLEVLGGSRTAAAAALLRRFLDPGIPVRPLDEDLVVEPFEGFLPPRSGEVYAAFSDGAFAAILLARRGDRESLPAIRALRESAPEEDRAILDEALELLSR